jgi:hypothetical protein
MEVIIIATPLIEPNFSKVTELLMKVKFAEYPTVKRILIATENTISRNHKSIRLYKIMLVVNQ